MNRFVIVDCLPYLLRNGKTFAVRWNEKGFTVGAEVELASVPTVTHSDIAIKAKCRGHLDSIAAQQEPEQEQEVQEPEQEQEVQEPEQEQEVQEPEQEQEVQEPEQEQEEVDFSGMTVPELKEYAASNGIDLGDARKKADILEAIQNANAQDVIDNDSDS